jgi:hypothetical protein
MVYGKLYKPSRYPDCLGKTGHYMNSCAMCADQTKLLNILSTMKKDLEDIKLMKKDLEAIKLATLDTQKREVDHWRRVDALMMFMQYLQQAIAKRGKGKALTKQVFTGLHLGPGF